MPAIDGTPSLAVGPPDGLIDNPLSVRLDGFPPNSRILVESTTMFGTASTWRSASTYKADGSGSVDLSQARPVEGSHDTTDPSALIWSLRPDDSSANPRALGEGFRAYELTVVARSGDIELRQTIVRRAIAESVRVSEIREDGLFINLFLPQGNGPFPTVLVVGGSGGGFADRQAALIASHGFAAVSLAYFNVPGLPDDLRLIPLEYFELALEWITDREDLDSSRLAISGTSRGGELALLLASRYPAIRSVVAWVPSSHLWGAVSLAENVSDESYFASWTLSGKALPYVGRVRNDDVEPDSDGVLRLTPAFHRYLDDADVAEPARIPVERINGPVLLVSGRDDALWPSSHFGEEIVGRLGQNGFDFEVQHLSYDEAGHGIGAGIAPTTVTTGFHPVRKATIAFGGTPAGLARARADSWEKALQFLKRNATSAKSNIS